MSVPPRLEDRRASKMRQNEMSQLTIDTNLNKPGAIRHKSVIHQRVDFYQAFKDHNSMELYKNIYYTQVERNLYEIDDQIFNFKDAFKNLKTQIDSQPADHKFDPTIPKIAEISKDYQLLEGLIEYHYALRRETSNVQLLETISANKIKDLADAEKAKKILLDPEPFLEAEVLHQKLKSKYDILIAKFAELTKIIGLGDLSNRFLLDDSINSMLLKSLKICRGFDDAKVTSNLLSFHKDFTKLIDKIYDSSSLTTEKDQVIKKSDAEMQLENKIRTEVVEYVYRVFRYWEKYGKMDKVLDDLSTYARSLEIIIAELKGANEQSFIQGLDSLEKTLDENDELIAEASSAIHSLILPQLQKISKINI